MLSPGHSIQHFFMCARRAGVPFPVGKGTKRTFASRGNSPHTRILTHSFSLIDIYFQNISLYI